MIALTYCSIYFSQAIAQWGTDFGIIHKMFKQKSRINVRNKFKREDRLNHSRVQHALNNRAPMGKDDIRICDFKDGVRLRSCLPYSLSCKCLWLTYIFSILFKL